MKETIVLTEKEYQEVNQVLEARRDLRCFFGAANVVVAGAIFALSKTGVDLNPGLIYVLLRVFVVCGVSGVVTLLLGLWSEVVLLSFQRGVCDMIVCNKPHSCVNKVKRELKGKKYVMLRCLSVRYALRLENE